MSDFDDLVSDVQEQPRFRVTVPLLLDSVAYLKHQELEQQLEKALLSPDDDDVTAAGPSAIAEQIRELLAAERTRTFVFEQLDADEWDQLASSHTKGDGQVNEQTFWPDVMAASCVEPEGATAAGFLALKHGDREAGKKALNTGQWQQLLGGCRQANQGLFDIRPSYAASALIRGMRQRSDSAPSTASLSPGSEDE